PEVEPSGLNLERQSQFVAEVLQLVAGEPELLTSDAEEVHVLPRRWGREPGEEELPADDLVVERHPVERAEDVGLVKEAPKGLEHVILSVAVDRLVDDVVVSIPLGGEGD